MKRMIWLAVFVLVLGAASTALAWKKPPFKNVDRNGDGVIVFEEIRVFNPNLTMEGFAFIDTNKDGKIDRGEYATFGHRRARRHWRGKWWRCSSRQGVTLYARGTDLLIAGKNAQAKEVLQQAVTKPLCVDYLGFAYYNLGIACMRLGDDACAKTSLERARALDVNNVVPSNDFGLSGTPRTGGTQ